MDNQNYSEETRVKKEQDTKHISPSKLEEFIPWACGQLQVAFTVVIKKTELKGFNSSMSATPRGRKSQKMKDDLETDSDAGKSLPTVESGEMDHTGIVYINTVYDSNKYLIQMRFLKNFNIPNILIKIICLAMPFHPYLTTIYIERGLNESAVYELWKLLSVTKITEMTLDDTDFIQANYYILLGRNSPLKYLSLARCKINDAVIEQIALNLSCLMSAGRNLCALNLTTNRITDLGAKYIGDALKINRKLCYLNLSGNMITDTGAASILDTLQEFPLSAEDIKEKKYRHLVYLKEKNALIKKIVTDMRIDDFDKQNVRRKSRKAVIPPSVKKGKTSDRSSLSSVPTYIDNLWYDKAEAYAINSLGSYSDAYGTDNTVIRGGNIYCLGNNILSCLNLAYNSLSYCSVKKIRNVLYTQKDLNRNPKGLMKISIDGNNIPEYCVELSDIESTIGSCIAASTKTTSVSGKKLQTKSSTK